MKNKEPVEYPVDHPRGWYPVVGGFLCFFWAWGGWYAWNVLFVTLRTEFSASHESVAWVSSFAAGFLQFSSFGSGLLAQRFSAQFVVGLGTFAMSAGYLMSSFATDLWVLYITYGVVVGCGSGALTVCSVSLVSQWFTKYRSSAVTWVTAGSGVGALALSPIFDVLNTTYGWRTCLRVMAGASFGTNIIATLLMIRRSKPKAPVPFEVRWMRDPVFIVFATGLPFMYYGYWVFNVFMADYAESIGMSSTAASLLISVNGVTNTVGRIILAWLLLKKLDPLIAYSVSLVFRGIFTIFFPLITNAAGLYVFTVIGSLLSAGGLMLPVLVAKYFPVSIAPATNGIIYAFAGFGSLIGTPTVGILIDNDSYLAGASVGGAALIVAGIWCLLAFKAAKMTRVQDKNAAKLAPILSTPAPETPTSSLLRDDELRSDNPTNLYQPPELTSNQDVALLSAKT